MQFIQKFNAVLAPHDHLRRICALAIIVAVASASGASRLDAQTDYYNTDRGRPIQIEDAYVAERYGIELKLAPLRLERARGGVYNWGIEPEIAYGILPRTQIEVGLPLSYREVGTERQSGIAGLDFSVMHNLNAETEGWPALGIRADVLAPVGNLAPSRAYPSITGIATRTYTWGRVHMNAKYTAGSSLSAASTSSAGAEELSRWLIGGAVDRTFPLRSTLITAELYGRKPLITGEDVEYNTGAGVRHQFTPTLALDAGLGRRLNGDAPGWYVTFGSSFAFGVASLFPTGR
ncbi:MAG: transporter [Gemmatimonadaceae bacterium]|nr:transporter [Gemmatimonadaceae bacterium]